MTGILEFLVRFQFLQLLVLRSSRRTSPSLSVFEAVRGKIDPCNYPGHPRSLSCALLAHGFASRGGDSG